jgi:hypothetical protein
MPQLAKGGKYVFGWSKVGDQGEIVIPLEALEEYNLTTDKNVILMSGSKTSGGFGLTMAESLKNQSPPDVSRICTHSHWRRYSAGVCDALFCHSDLCYPDGQSFRPGRRGNA